MTAVRFTVETTFDISARRGLLAPGVLESGVIKGGMTLQNEATDQPVRILGVEFQARAQVGTNKVTLLIDREDAAAVESGTVLIGES